MNHERGVLPESNVKACEDLPKSARTRKNLSTPCFDADDEVIGYTFDQAPNLENATAKECCLIGGPSAVMNYDNMVEITHFPISTPRHCLQSKTEENGEQCFHDGSTLNTKVSQQLYCRCCCRETHHHYYHHHHTIFINGHEVRNSSNTLRAKPHDVGFFKPSPSRTAGGGNRNSDRSAKISADRLRSHDVASRYPVKFCPLNSYVQQNHNNSERHDEAGYSNGIDESTDCQSKKCVVSRKCCGKPSLGMLLLITVLIVVIVSLMSGLIYFLIRGNVTHTDSPSPDRKVSSITTISNQTPICGKLPDRYYSLYPTTSSKKSSGLYPSENDNGLNISVVARIIGGVPANIAHYQSHISSRGPMPESLVDASKVRGRIFGGTDTVASVFPWQVSLWVKSRGKTCGGSLIMKDWVLTAAHCTDSNSNPALWTAYMGMTLMTEKLVPPAQRSKVLALIQHPNYTGGCSYDYDVSLLKLKTPMLYSPTVQPICLPNLGSEYLDGTKCYISGWGVTTNSGHPNAPNTLQHAQVDIIGYNTCRKIDWLGMLVTDRMLCAGKADGSTDACQGDSGGPLSCYDNERKTWTLTGSVSWGIDCGKPKQPGVYAKISFFVHWIWKNIGQYDDLMYKSNDVEEKGSGEDSQS